MRLRGQERSKQHIKVDIHHRHPSPPPETEEISVFPLHGMKVAVLRLPDLKVAGHKQQSVAQSSPCSPPHHAVWLRGSFYYRNDTLLFRRKLEIEGKRLRKMMEEDTIAGRKRGESWRRIRKNRRCTESGCETVERTVKHKSENRFGRINKDPGLVLFLFPV